MDPYAVDPNMEVDEIHAIVYGGREFHRRNAISVPLYTVFGVGGSTYKTAAHPHRSPDWNESATFLFSQIRSASVPFRFQVFEQRREDQRDKLIGTAILPLQKLPNKEASKESVIRLKHPDEPKVTNDTRLMFRISPTSEGQQEQLYHFDKFRSRLVNHTNEDTISSGAYLIYECFVVKRRPKDTRPVISWWNRTVPKVVDSIVHTEIRRTIKSVVLTPLRRPTDSVDFTSSSSSSQLSPFLIRKLMESHASIPVFPTMSDFAVAKIQSAVNNVAKTAEAQTQTHYTDIPPTFMFTGPIEQLERTEELAEKELIVDSRQDCNREAFFQHIFPVIDEIEPDEGSVLGGTRIAITGKDLGTCAADIISLTVCGSDCLPSLEYESDKLIYCKTKAWRACIGTVVVITHSGGRSRSKDTARFSFIAPSEPCDGADFPDIVPTTALDDNPNLDDEIVVPDKWAAFLRSVDEGTQTATTYDSEIKQIANLLEENAKLKLALEETKRELDGLRRKSAKREADG